MNDLVNKILEKTDELMIKNIPTARFGNNWKQHAEKKFSKDELINIAHYQGRKNICLIEAMKEILSDN